MPTYASLLKLYVAHASAAASGALERASSKLITACVVARLPAVITVMTRSPGLDQVNILRNFEILSTPAFVRVSDMKMR